MITREEMLHFTDLADMHDQAGRDLCARVIRALRRGARAEKLLGAVVECADDGALDHCGFTTDENAEHPGRDFCWPDCECVICDVRRHVRAAVSRTAAGGNDDGGM